MASVDFIKCSDAQFYFSFLSSQTVRYNFQIKINFIFPH